MIWSKSVLIALVAGGIGVGGLQVVHAANQVKPAAVAGDQRPGVQKLDDDQYPHMHKALEDLRAAKHSLENAEPHFKGHRDKAIERVDQAIKECEDAIAEG
jgi:hypothetical protein